VKGSISFLVALPDYLIASLFFFPPSLSFLYLFLTFFLFETKPCYAAQVGLEFVL
jgi:hypothetical protein